MKVMSHSCQRTNTILCDVWKYSAAAVIPSMNVYNKYSDDLVALLWQLSLTIFFRSIRKISGSTSYFSIQSKKTQKDKIYKQHALHWKAFIGPKSSHLLAWTNWWKIAFSFDLCLLVSLPWFSMWCYSAPGWITRIRLQWETWIEHQYLHKPIFTTSTFSKKCHFCLKAGIHVDSLSNNIRTVSNTNTTTQLPFCSRN